MCVKLPYTASKIYAFTYTAVPVDVGYQDFRYLSPLSTARDGPVNLLPHDLQLQSASI